MALVPLTACRFVFLGNVVESPIIYESTAPFSSSIQAVILYGERFLLGYNASGPPSDPSSKATAEMTAGNRNKAIPVTISHLDDNVMLCLLKQVRLTNKDRGPVKARVTIGEFTTAWVQVGVMDIGRLALPEKHSLLTRTDGMPAALPVVAAIPLSQADSRINPRPA